MDITFTCGKCGQELSIDEAGAGMEVQCPTCQTTLVVPKNPPAQVASSPQYPNEDPVAHEPVSTNQCPKCRAEVPVGARRCARCGERFLNAARSSVLGATANQSPPFTASTELITVAQKAKRLRITAAAWLLAIGGLTANLAVVGLTYYHQAIKQQIVEARKNDDGVHPSFKGSFFSLCYKVADPENPSKTLTLPTEPANKIQSVTMVMGVGGFMLLAGGLAFLGRMYRAWKFVVMLCKALAIKPSVESAGQAVGFLFIPLFNFYWLFRFCAIGADINKVVASCRALGALQCAPHYGFLVAALGLATVLCSTLGRFLEGTAQLTGMTAAAVCGLIQGIALLMFSHDTQKGLSPVISRISAQQSETGQKLTKEIGGTEDARNSAASAKRIGMALGIAGTIALFLYLLRQPGGPMANMGEAAVVAGLFGLFGTAILMVVSWAIGLMIGKLRSRPH